MSTISSQSVFSNASSSSSGFSGSPEQSPTSSTFSGSNIAWLSSAEVEAAMEREKKLVREDLERGVKVTTGDESDRRDWKKALGPTTGRKLGKILSKSGSARSLRISSPVHLKPLDDPETAYNRTPPLSSSRSSTFKWFF
ncbi:hypothetical protein JCM5353_007495 [Sporobolomyces roseus]